MPSNNRIITGISLLLLSISLATGCGNGPPDNAIVTELTDAETQILCQESVNVITGNTPTLEQSCSRSAMIRATDQASCEIARDACIAEGPLEPDGPWLPDCANVQTPTGTCDLTVGEVRTCNAESAEQSQLRNAFYDCANAGMEFPALGPLASCQASTECYMD